MTSEHEETIYDEEGRGELAEDGEISPEEEAFMQGYDEADEESDDTSSEEEDPEENL